MLIIDAFKTDLFERLKVHNKWFVETLHEICIKKGERYFYKEEPTREISHWFDVERIRHIPLPRHYPNLIPLNFHEKLCLLENPPNYVSIFLINLLFADRKDIMIEDACCGQGKFAVLLSHLGFKNHSFIDNFSQIRPELLTHTIAKAGLKLRLNEPVEQVRPVVFNQVAYPGHVREYCESTEIFCHYRVIDWFDGLPIAKNYRRLCTDSDDLMVVHCRNDKYDEFADKIRPYVVGQC
jgi:hypothetical protein